jgi:hypothetical protein
MSPHTQRDTDMQTASAPTPTAPDLDATIAEIAA